MVLESLNKQLSALFSIITFYKWYYIKRPLHR